MRTIRVTVSMGLVGCKRHGDFEIEDDATDDEIDEVAKEVLFNLIEWNWVDAKAK